MGNLKCYLAVFCYGQERPLSSHKILVSSLPTKILAKHYVLVAIKQALCWKITSKSFQFIEPTLLKNSLRIKQAWKIFNNANQYRNIPYYTLQNSTKSLIMKRSLRHTVKRLHANFLFFCFILGSYFQMWAYYFYIVNLVIKNFPLGVP